MFRAVLAYLLLQKTHHSKTFSHDSPASDDSQIKIQLSDDGDHTTVPP
jgi:hypothetical protein